MLLNLNKHRAEPSQDFMHFNILYTEINGGAKQMKFV